MKKMYRLILLAGAIWLMPLVHMRAQGTWNKLTNAAPNGNGGVMLLLSDGTVMVVSEDSANVGGNRWGNIWNLLTPDIHGSYANGTWTSLPAMHDTRLYFSSQVLPNGNVYVAGGEYGSGGNTAEVFNTQTKTWNLISGGIQSTWDFLDANSKLLSDGTVLQAVVTSTANASANTLIYSPLTNSYTVGSSLLGSDDEASWVTLPDGSIMNIDIQTRNLERYIPQQKNWITDANLATDIYDNTLGETGAGFLLPNGKAFFLGDSINTAIYTPSGSSSPGTWVNGPAMPKVGGVQYGCPDAPAAMMANGNILCAFSPAGTYNTPLYFYEFNYLTNTFTQVSVPTGGTSMANTATYFTTLLDLPDGTVLFAEQGNKNYYQYTPSGSPLVAGKPTITNITSNCPDFLISGTLFTGISEGAVYGDDWQMATNYPIVRITNGTNVYYARTSNWNRPGSVMTGSLEDTASFSIPVIPAGTYSVVLIVNGNPSNPYPITLPCSSTTGVFSVLTNQNFNIYPNPSKNGLFQMESSFSQMNSRVLVYNMLGEIISNELSQQVSGVYYYKIFNAENSLSGAGKLIIEK